MSARARLEELQLGFALLTRLPPGRLSDTLPSIAEAAWAYPVIGAFVGLVSGAIYVGTGQVLPTLPAALLAVGAGVLLTGGLHEDGLADVADGFGGGGDVERKLEIMRDSRIGSYGVLAIVLIIGLTASAISAARPALEVLPVFAAIGALSRAAMLFPMATLAPARNDGLGQKAALPRGWRLWVGLFSAALLALIVTPALILAAAFAAIAMVATARNQIGGQTGDVLGATQKLSECACWLTIAALL